MQNEESPSTGEKSARESLGGESLSNVTETKRPLWTYERCERIRKVNKLTP